ncbi:family 2 glycosyl transferase [Microbacterium sp. Gd 4-13]|uniref:glycosyltransferase n=1 Tax=Microbacterium sp. Gd 4-13 TaxID=2173179 RepID=UPI000D56A476|nr:glycosyltransferase [Microbacterium sp. Gd 4-13]PVW06086.1 family 2 glycosyl transferase [Microbacterium sp. Gd 4-13]
MPAESYANLPGAIVLAAYSPEPEMFARQLRSIAAQTLVDWTCIVVVDGDVAPVRALVVESVADDNRFTVIGDGSRLGFYLNFERGLYEVPVEAAWVALSDQDDFWYPTKLQTLVPSLDTVALATGGVRLVEYPSGAILGEAERRASDPLFTMLNNEYTGSATVFRSSILQVALPFPRASTRTAAHDHWLAVVSGAVGGTALVSDSVQDYVQHTGNVFGDPRQSAAPWSLPRAVRNVREMTARYEGTSGPLAMLRMMFWLNVGWRQLLTETLTARVGSDRVDPRIKGAFGRDRKFTEIAHLIRRARQTGVVGTQFALEYVVSWVAGILIAGRSSVSRQRPRERA